MSHLIDLTGQTFGRLTVIARAANDKNWNTRWYCQCDCGNKTIVYTSNLRRNFTESCGCIHSEATSKIQKTHGMSHTVEYKTWKRIKARCGNPKNPSFHRYGGRGIKVCPEWVASFELFFEHLGNRPSDKHSIERINNNKGYGPGNVKWATPREQANNRRSNHLETFNGKTRTLAQWGNQYGINPTILLKRLRRGWTFKRAISESARHY